MSSTIIEFSVVCNRVGSGSKSGGNKGQGGGVNETLHLLLGHQGSGNSLPGVLRRGIIFRQSGIARVRVIPTPSLVSRLGELDQASTTPVDAW